VNLPNDPISVDEAVDAMHEAFLSLMGVPGSREAMEKLQQAMNSDDPVAAYYRLLKGGTIEADEQEGGTPCLP